MQDARVLPNNLEAEQALLGILLYDNDAMERVNGLTGAAFYEPLHGRLFDAIETRIRKGQRAEPMLLNPGFEGDPAYIELGGHLYLGDMVDRAPPSPATPDYVAAILDAAMRRELIRIGDEALVLANDYEVTGREHLETVEGQVFALAENSQKAGGFVEFCVAADEALEMASVAFSRDGSVSGVSTGLRDLDAKLGGLHPSDLLILAGRPSMGKTALATNIAFNVASSYKWQDMPDGSRKTIRGGVVGFYSLEMSRAQLGLRLLADASGISGDRIRKGQIEAHEFGRLREANQRIRDIPLHIDDTGGQSIGRIAAHARRLKRRHGLDLIVVDYLQLATSPQKSGGNRVQEVSEITAALKALAKELSVPVLALSQLSRQVEQREDKRPMLSDLRESGSIEQDADAVMFVYREAYYVGRAEPSEGSGKHLEWQMQLSDCRNLAEVIIGKQRHGPIGTVKLSFNEDTTKFGDLAREHQGVHTRSPYGDN